MSDQPAGPILDGLGVTLDLDDGDLIAGAVVIAKVVTTESDDVSLLIAGSEGMSWLDHLGLLAAARDLVSDGYMRRGETD